MAYVAAAAAVAGLALSAYSKHKAAKIEAEQSRRQSILMNSKADRILELNEINAQRIEQDILFTQGSASTKFAASNRVADIELLGDIAARGAREIEQRTEMAEFEAEMIRLGAEATLTNARNFRRAANIEILGQGLSTASSLARSTGGTT